MSLRIIRELWLARNAGLLATLVLAHPIGLIVMGVADVVLAIAWVWAIGRALMARRPGWAVVIAVWPLAMWGYIFGLAEQGTLQEQAAPTRPAASTVHVTNAPSGSAGPSSDEPLAIRQARDTIAEAERLYPDW